MHVAVIGEPGNLNPKSTKAAVNRITGPFLPAR